MTSKRQKVSQGCQTDALPESNWPNRNLMDYAPTEDPDELLARQLRQELQTNAETSAHLPRYRFGRIRCVKPPIKDSQSSDSFERNTINSKKLHAPLPEEDNSRK